MTRPERRPRRGPSRACRLSITLSTTTALVAGLLWALFDSPGETAVGRTATAASHPSLPRARALRITIPSLGVDAPVTGVGLDRAGRVAGPPMSNANLVGWYRYGFSPGEKGTAVAVGHRDTHREAAVFVNLGALRRGDVINVLRADRRTAVFTVDAVRTLDKRRFPDDEVYGATGRPELRLLTCGGTFDRRSGGYSANIVVFSHLTGVKPA